MNAADRWHLTRAVLAAWRQGHDTTAIARTLSVAERVVYRIIAEDQDRRHAARLRPAQARSA